MDIQTIAEFAENDDIMDVLRRIGVDHAQGYGVAKPHAMEELFFSNDHPAGRRFRIEHAQHLRPEAFSRFAAAGVIASMQPYHAIDDGRWAEKRLAHELGPQAGQPAEVEAVHGHVAADEQLRAHVGPGPGGVADGDDGAERVQHPQRVGEDGAAGRVEPGDAPGAPTPAGRRVASGRRWSFSCRASTRRRRSSSPGRTSSSRAAWPRSRSTGPARARPASPRASSRPTRRRSRRRSTSSRGGTTSISGASVSRASRSAATTLRGRLRTSSG